MAKYVSLFRGALGLNMRTDPARLRMGEDGLCELAEAINVDVTDSYRISRRPGMLSTSINIPVHSLFSALGVTLFVSEGSLYRLDPGPAVTELLSGLTPDARMSFVPVNHLIYFANGHEKGIYDVVHREIQEWGTGEYIGPSTTRTFEDPPAGHILEHYNGRIYIGQDSLLWFTEPFGYNWVDYSQNLIVFPARITMLRAVADGLYVSTPYNVYFLDGAGPEAMAQRIVATSGVIEGTDVFCEADSLGGEDTGMQVAGMQGVICTTNEGICFAGPGGYFRNLTKERLYFPVQNIGAAYIYRGKYVVTME